MDKSQLGDRRGRDGWYVVPLAEDLSLREIVAKGAKDGTFEISTLTDQQLDLVLKEAWAATRRPSQEKPTWDWTVWYIQAGRGAGKTRTGSETICEWAEEHGPGFRGACVGPTLADVRLVMFEGESGILSRIPKELLATGDLGKDWNRATVELFLKDGGKLQGYSSEVASRLRGPQHHKAWADELAAWDDATLGPMNDTTWFHMMAGLRLRSLAGHPQVVVTTTPKPNALVKWLGGDKCTLKVARYRGSSHANLLNLSEAFIDSVIKPAQGTRMGQQEIDALVVEDFGDVFDLENLDIVARVPRDKKGLTYIRYWDLASTEPHEGNRDPDWTVGTLAALDTRRHEMHYIVDSEWFRLRPGKRDKKIAEIAAADRDRYGIVTQWIEIDPGGAGEAQQHQLQRELDGVQPVKGNRPSGKKHVRAELAVSPIEQGRVAMVEAPWNGAAIEQMTEMTTDDTHSHDDFVDTISGLFFVLGKLKTRYRTMGPIGTPKEPNTLGKI